MARDILGEFGPDVKHVDAERITSNRPVEKKDVMGYQPPTGPKYMMSTGVGLRGGTNYGNAGSQGKGALSAEASGRPGDLTTHNFHDGFDSDDSGREPHSPLREDD